MRKDESGYIVVETVGSFTLFVLLIASILSLVNIATLQARVHYALTQTAETLSMYSYTLEVTGVAGHLANLNRNANNVRVEADTFKSNFDDLMNAMQSFGNGHFDPVGVVQVAKNTGGQVGGWIKNTANDPKKTIGQILCVPLDDWRNAAAAKVLLTPMVERYLSNGEQSGDAYLRSVNVVDGMDGLTFDGSVIIDSNGDVVIVARYDVEYTFGALPLPFRPVLNITQTVKTKAWLNGNGKGYAE